MVFVCFIIAIVILIISKRSLANASLSISGEILRSVQNDLVFIPLTAHSAIILNF